MLKKEDVKNDVDYWFSSAYFKHSSGQLSKTHRIIKPRKVKIEFRNNDVYLSDSVTNQRINHPLYYCFQSYNTVIDNYFGNFVFETEKRHGIISIIRSTKKLKELMIFMKRKDLCIHHS